MSVRQKRKGSDWRHRMFRNLCQRDGVHCQECKSPPRTIWVAAGIYVNNFEENWRYTYVYPRSTLEVDHKIPLCEGGSNDIKNLWLLCIDCHAQKTSKERSLRMVGNRIAVKRVFA
jgi:5-methylcytosine-specific restriction endonuclease McrA